MIKFKCPECGNRNEVSDRKGGMEMRCTRCDEWIDIPDPDRKKKKEQEQRKAPKTFLDRDHLTPIEFWGAMAFFFFFPGIGIVAGVFLYILWNADYPTKAYQALQAAMIPFIVHVLLCCCVGCLGVADPTAPNRGRRFNLLERPAVLVQESRPA